MKAIKYLAMFFAAGALFAGCSDNDDELNNQNAGKPQPTVTLSQTAAVDGSFTFTIAASAEASQYGYAVFEGKGNPAPKALDIVCGEVSGSFDYGVFNVAEGASQTVTIECDAAADYEVFAAAITGTGLVGNEVAKMECYVPDQTNPAPVSFRTAENAVAVTFSEPIVLTDKGSATVMYIQWVAGEVIGPVALTKDDISVSDDTATFTCPKPADGAGYIVNFTEGLFADLSGNPAPGIKSGLDQNGKYVNLGWNAPTKEFVIEEDSFVMWTDETDVYNPATTIDFVLPRECIVNEKVKNPVSVKYVTAEGEKTLYAEFELGEDGKTVKVTRPEIPLTASFDVVVVAGAFLDAWGNPSAAFTPSKLRYSTSAVEIQYGTYSVSYVDLDEKTYKFPAVLEPYDNGEVVLHANWFGLFTGLALPSLVGTIDYATNSIEFDGRFLYKGSLYPDPAFGMGFYDFDEEGRFLVFWGGGASGTDPIVVTFDDEGYLSTISYCEYAVHEADGGYAGPLSAMETGTFTFVPEEEAATVAAAAKGKIPNFVEVRNWKTFSK